MNSFLEYELPAERIAQRPAGLARSRSTSRLLHIQAGGGSAHFTDRFVAELPQILRRGDLLILNDTKVLPVRFFIERAGGGETEILLLSREPVADPLEHSEIWEALARPMKRLRAGDTILLSAALSAEVLGRTDEGDRLRLRISIADGNPGRLSIAQCIERDGSMPIPGYIREGRADEKDRSLYQTVFAREPGSVAAPTAGLHFTDELLAELKLSGIDHRFLTLHVGPASFQPVRDQETHGMPEERYTITPETWEAIERTKKNGGRIVAVGTTTTRALEGAFAAQALDPLLLFQGATSIFITPGFRFQVVDLLMTNFHQPRTTHLLLVAAIIGEAVTADAYQHALRGEYRFLSYGDAMILERSVERSG